MNSLFRRGTAILTAIVMLVMMMPVTISEEAICAVERIDLNIDAVTIGVDQNIKTIKPVAYPEGSATKFSWESENPSIAKVNEKGKIKGMKKGTTTITVSAGNGVKAEVEVNVVKKGKGVTKIALNNKTASITRGKSATLKATLTPKKPKNKTIIWESSNEAVATVDSKGKVTGVSAGTATISAISSSGKTAKCKVTVTGLKVKKIKLSGKKEMLRNETQQLTAKITPADADNQELKWTSSNKKIATVDQKGVVTARKKGSVTITATAKDGSKVKGAFKITVKKGVFKPHMFVWSLDSDGNATIVNYIGVGGDVTIPETIEGYPVVYIGNTAFAECTNLTSITIPDCVISIGAYAFGECNNLASIIIPDSVTSIGDAAFSDCSCLTSITLPNGVTCIKQNTFASCTSLINIIIPDGVTSIGDNAFWGCSSLTGLTIPQNVTCIGDYAFWECSNLNNVIIPDSVTSIGSYAFLDCSNLSSITIPESVTAIGEYAFYKCSDDLVIYGVKGSYVEIYASENGIIFVAEGEAVPTATPTLEPTTEPTVEPTLEPIDFEYSTSGRGAIVTGYTGVGGNVTIPDELHGHSVIGIQSYAFSNCTSLISITIPDSVTTIGNFVFNKCSSLMNVTIPDSVTSIGDYAFSECGRLTCVTMPASMTSMGEGAFWYCESLTSVTISDGVTSIGDSAFCGCSSLTNVTIPASVTSIGWCAFSGCGNLTSVTIPDSVTNIGDYAFAGCSSLTSVTISDGVTSIGEGSFSDCSSLSSVTIPASVTNIRDSSFYGCSSLISVTISDGVTSIGDGAFYYCSNLTSVTIPASVTNIGDGAFSVCSSDLIIYGVPGSFAESYAAENGHKFEVNSFDTVTPTPVPTATPTVKPTAVPTPVATTIPEITEAPEQTAEPTYEPVDFEYTVDSDGNATIIAYVGMGGYIVIPDTIHGYPVKAIASKAFESCATLISVTIPDNVTSIGNYAFDGCSSLISVTISDSVTSIGVGAFRYCESLTSMTIPDSVTSIRTSTFDGCSSLMSVTIPDSVTSIGNYAFEDCSSLTSVTIPDSVTSIGDYAFVRCSSLTSVTIPNSVTSIGNFAFGSCSSLTSVTIPDSVTSIEAGTFDSCSSLTSVTIPDSVTSIGSNAFSGCRRLTSVTIPDSMTSIGASAFSSCSSLTSVTIPDSVTSIGSVVFCYCRSLTSVTIPDSVTSIGENAFTECSDDLIIYGVAGSVAESYAAGNSHKFEICSFDDPDTTTPALDMSSASLNADTYAPGDTITISGIKVRNADYVHISGNNLLITEENCGESAFDVLVENSSEYQILDDINMILSADNAVEGKFYISVRAYGSYGKASEIDKTTLEYYVVFDTTVTPEPEITPEPTITPEPGIGELKWAVSYDTYYTTITVNIASGTPDANTDYLFIAEDADGLHYPGDSTPNIAAGATSASFRIKDLQMKRAKAYDLYVLPAGISLTDDNREEYFITDVVLPLWGGNMISEVRSGDIDVTSAEKLYIGDTVEIDWEGSYGVYNVEVVAELNGQILSGFPKIYDDPELIDRDKPVTTTIDSSLLENAEEGDILKVTVTVTPSSEAQALLTGADCEPIERKEWEGTFEKKLSLSDTLFTEGGYVDYESDSIFYSVYGEKAVLPSTPYIRVVFPDEVNFLSESINLRTDRESLTIEPSKIIIFDDSVQLTFEGELPPMDRCEIVFSEGSLQHKETGYINASEITFDFCTGFTGTIGEYDDYRTVDFGKQIGANDRSTWQVFVVDYKDKYDALVFFVDLDNIPMFFVSDVNEDLISSTGGDKTDHVKVFPKYDGNTSETHIIWVKYSINSDGQFSVKDFEGFDEVSLTSDDKVEIYTSSQNPLTEDQIKRYTWASQYAEFVTKRLFPEIYTQHHSVYKYILHNIWNIWDGYVGVVKPNTPDIIAIQPEMLLVSTDSILSTIAHETQHSVWAINFEQNYTFMNEVMSESIARETLVLYNELSGTDYSDEPDILDIIEIKDLSKSKLYTGLTSMGDEKANYTAYYYFGCYLEERIGLSGINNILKQMKSLSSTLDKDTARMETEKIIAEICGVSSFYDADDSNCIIADFMEYIDAL